MFSPFSFLNSPDLDHSYDNCAAFNLIFVSVVIPQPVAEPLNTHTDFFFVKSNSKSGKGLYGFLQLSGYISFVILNISSSVGVGIS